MTEEIKEILDKLKDSVNNPISTEVDQFTEEAYDVPNYFVLDTINNECKTLLDYITNLQQENNALNLELSGYREAILKDDKLLGLQQENERLKQNQSGFTLEDYTRLLNNYQELQKEHQNCTRKHWQEKCGEHHAKELIYKSRCEKAIEYIKENYPTSTINYQDDKYKLINILNGSDENETK